MFPNENRLRTVPFRSSYDLEYQKTYFRFPAEEKKIFLFSKACKPALETPSLLSNEYQGLCHRGQFGFPTF